MRIRNNLISGFFAALASTIGKLAMEIESNLDINKLTIEDLFGQNFLINYNLILKTYFINFI